MAKKILAALGVVVLLLVGVVAMQPAEFAIKRSATINAPAAVVSAQIADFKAWGGWSPWDKMDPNMARTYSEPSGGLGANYHWKGNKDAGEGHMKITALEPNKQIVIALDFVEPFPASNVTTFDFAEASGATTVTWTMTGKNGFMSKAFGLVMNMDKMVGGDFEKGLSSLKTVSEAQAAEVAKKAAEETAAAEAAKKAAEEAAASDAGVVDAGTP